MYRRLTVASIRMSVQVNEKQFQLLMHSIHDLKPILEEDAPRGKIKSARKRWIKCGKIAANRSGGRH